MIHAFIFSGCSTLIHLKSIAYFCLATRWKCSFPPNRSLSALSSDSDRGSEGSIFPARRRRSLQKEKKKSHDSNVPSLLCAERVRWGFADRGRSSSEERDGWIDGWIDGWMGSCGSARHTPAVLLGTLHDPTWVHDPRHRSVPGIFSGAEPAALVLIQRPARYVEAASLPFPAAPRPGSQGRAALRCSAGAPLAVSRAAFKQPGTAR